MLRNESKDMFSVGKIQIVESKILRNESTTLIHKNVKHLIICKICYSGHLLVIFRIAKPGVL